MRIQSINNYNQNNISHKAYFRQNESLKHLCKTASKDINLANTVDRFKNSLPNHELELTRIFPSRNFLNSALYKVTNHTLNKAETIEVTNDSSALSVLLNRIYLYRETLFAKDENIINIDLFKELTTRNK